MNTRLKKEQEWAGKKRNYSTPKQLSVVTEKYGVFILLHWIHLQQNGGYLLSKK
jgi:hypothetical protein